MKYRIDLHLHTNRSDGSLSPKELVMLAGKKGLKAIAITDHDTVSGLREGAASSRLGVEVVPCVEIGIKNEEEKGLTEIHILGYIIDYENKKLLSVLEKINESKKRWLPNQIKVLNDIGVYVNVDEIKKDGRLGNSEPFACLEGSGKKQSK